MKVQAYTDFSGGLRTNGEASKIKFNETHDGVNGIATPSGSLTVIPGIQKLMDQSGSHSTKKITMLANFTKSDGTSEVIVAYDGLVKKLNMTDGTVSDLPTPISGHNTTKNYGYVSYDDKFYFCNGIDDMQEYTGSANTVKTLTNVAASTFKTDTFVIFERKMYAVDYGNKLLLHRSQTDNITTFNYTGGATVENSGTTKVAEGNTPITSLEVNSNLFIFSKNNIYNPNYTDIGGATVFSIDNINRGAGAITNDSTVAVGDLIIFFDAHDKNITQLGYKANFPGIQINGISEAIRNKLQDEYDLTDAKAIYWKRKYFIACKSSSSQAENDIVLIVDLDYNAIYLRSGWFVSCWMEYGGDLYFGSSLGAFIYKAWVGNDDDGALIPLNWSLKIDDFQEPSSYKNVNHLYVEGTIDDTQSLIVTCSFDNGRDTITKTIDGANTSYIIDTNLIGQLGNSELATYTLGGNTGESDRIFQVWLTLNARKFTNVQINFQNTGAPGNVSIRRAEFVDVRLDTTKPPSTRVI